MWVMGRACWVLNVLLVLGKRQQRKSQRVCVGLDLRPGDSWMAAQHSQPDSTGRLITNPAQPPSDPPSSAFLNNLLRYDSHTIQSTHLRVPFSDFQCIRRIHG